MAVSVLSVHLKKGDIRPKFSECKGHGASFFQTGSQFSLPLVVVDFQPLYG